MSFIIDNDSDIIEEKYKIKIGPTKATMISEDKTETIKATMISDDCKILITCKEAQKIVLILEYMITSSLLISQYNFKRGLNLYKIKLKSLLELDKYTYKLDVTNNLLLQIKGYKKIKLFIESKKIYIDDNYTKLSNELKTFYTTKFENELKNIQAEKGEKKSIFDEGEKKSIFDEGEKKSIFNEEEKKIIFNEEEKKIIFDKTIIKYEENYKSDIDTMKKLYKSYMKEHSNPKIDFTINQPTLKIIIDQEIYRIRLKYKIDVLKIYILKIIILIDLIIDVPTFVEKREIEKREIEKREIKKREIKKREIEKITNDAIIELYKEKFIKINTILQMIIVPFINKIIGDIDKIIEYINVPSNTPIQEKPLPENDVILSTLSETHYNKLFHLLNKSNHINVYRKSIINDKLQKGNIISINIATSIFKVNFPFPFHSKKDIHFTNLCILDNRAIISIPHQTLDLSCNLTDSIK